MKKKEKLARVVNLLAKSGITVENLKEWFIYCEKQEKETLFPMYEIEGNELRLLTMAQENWQDRVWGYQIFPGLILAKEVGLKGFCSGANWDNVKDFVQGLTFNSTACAMPSMELLGLIWGQKLRDNILAMDLFLREQGIEAGIKDGDKYRGGNVWGEELPQSQIFADLFHIDNGLTSSYNYKGDGSCVRVMVAFSH